MPRARNLKPGFFSNEDLAECSPWARLCFAGLWTLADREGRLEDRPKRIKGELFRFDSIEVEPLLVELERFGFVVRYQIDGDRFIQVSKFAEHQTPHYSEKQSVIKPPPLQESASIKKQDAQDKTESPPGDEQSSRGGCNPLNPESRILTPDEDSKLTLAPAFPPEKPPPLALVGDHDPQAKGPPDCPHQAVLALWAEVLPALPQHLPGQWKGARADHLRARWRETADEKGWRTAADGLAYLRKLFAYVGRSAFLTGRESSHGKRPFFVELEWLVRPVNWAKVHEGKYHPEKAA